MADTKITALTEDTAPVSTDLAVTVDDPGGTPVTKKATLANVITKAHGLSDGIVKVASGAMTAAVADTDYQGVLSEGAFADGDKTKLDGIETSADVTDATNVAAAGALMTDGSAEMSGDIVFAEKADHSSTPGAGKGYLWVKNTAPSSIVFTDDSGADTTLGAAGAGIADIVEDTTPQLGGQLDVNGNAIGDGTNELLTFTEDASAVNHINIENEATGAGPIISSTGDDTNVDLDIATKGSGTINLQANTDVTGNITVSGTVDGRDVAADGTKLDGIEASADVTDATNVTTALGSIGISAHSDVDTDKSKTPADGDVLTFDGTDWNAETPAAGGGGSAYDWSLIFSNQVDMTDATTGSTFNDTSGGTLAYANSMYQLKTSSGSANYAAHHLRNRDLDATGIAFWDRDMRLFFKLAPQFVGTGVCTMGVIVGGNADRTFGGSKYLGIKITQDSGSTRNVYVVSCDGTTEESTDVSAYYNTGNSNQAHTTFTVDFVSGTSAKFYVDGTLRATHSTNIPSGANSQHYYWGAAWIENGGSTSDNGLYVTDIQAHLKMT